MNPSKHDPIWSKQWPMKGILENDEQWWKIMKNHRIKTLGECSWDYPKVLQTVPDSYRLKNSELSIIFGKNRKIKISENRFVCLRVLARTGRPGAADGFFWNKPGRHQAWVAGSFLFFIGFHVGHLCCKKIYQNLPISLLLGLGPSWMLSMLGPSWRLSMPGPSWRLSRPTPAGLGAGPAG